MFMRQPKPNSEDDIDFNEASNFGFTPSNVPGRVFYNLHARSNAAVKDPLADIKKREKDLMNERLSRESELQREYEKRL